MSKVIGIDYGAKRVGISISDSMQIIATGLTTIPNSSIFSFLIDILNKEDISCIVVGDPRGLNGRDTDATLLVRKFIKKLASKFPEIQLETIDERFTSKIAKKSILESGVKRMERRNKGLVDKVSATIILQNYLDYR